jgi:C-terminal processing protease CtpA/Prc
MVRHVKLYLALILTAVLFSGCSGSSNDAAPVSAEPSQIAEKVWVRSHLDDVYLWFDEIVDVSPENYSSAPDFFSALLVRSKDRFSFSIPRTQADSMFQDGMATGFGIRWGWSSGHLYAIYVDPESPARGAIARGAEVLAVNGRAVGYLSGVELTEALFPERPGHVITLEIRAPGLAAPSRVTLTSAVHAITPVLPPVVISLADGSKAGYLLFTEHILTAEQELIKAMKYFQEQGVVELVLDLRYNGGGYLFIAEEVSAMIGGTAVQGQVFERLLFNSKHPELTNDPDNTLYFSPVDLHGNRLPLLGFKRVFIITGSGTCSASESIINSLTPFMPVIMIGWTTCGKPYGFEQASYGQQAYFAISFEGVNATGRNDFKSGFAPTCQVLDDLNYPLGDRREGRLNAALHYMTDGACPPVSRAKSALTDNGLALGDVEQLGQIPPVKILH